MLKFINRIILIISLFLLVYVVCLNLIYGPISFSKFIGLMATLGIVYGAIQVKTHDLLLSIFPPFFRNLIYIIFLVGILLFMVIESKIIYYSFHKDIRPVDKVIVLGAGLKGDQITSSLQYRLDEALNYYKQYPNTSFIVSGGQGKDEYLSEALAMKNYLVNHGMKEELIILEDQSTSTYENFKFSKQFIDPNDKVMIITNGFHIYRSHLIASRLGIEAYTLPAKSHMPSLINFYIREFFAYIKDYILIK